MKRTKNPVPMLLLLIHETKNQTTEFVRETLLKLVF